MGIFIYFFLDPVEDVWGSKASEAGTSRVLFADGDPETFVERPAPEGLAKDYISPRKWVSPARIEMMPDEQRLSDVFDVERDSEAYYQLWDPTYPEPNHQMLGYPSPAQSDDMEEVCQAVLNEIIRKNPDSIGEGLLSEPETDEHDWRLLLQLDSEGQGTGMGVGRCRYDLSGCLNATRGKRISVAYGASCSAVE